MYPKRARRKFNHRARSRGSRLPRMWNVLAADHQTNLGGKALLRLISVAYSRYVLCSHGLPPVKYRSTPANLVKMLEIADRKAASCGEYRPE